MLKIVRPLHKWIAVLVSAQLLFWTLSGVYFSWIHIDNIRGRWDAQPDESRLSAERFVPVEQVLSASTLPEVLSVEIKAIRGTPYYLLRGPGRHAHERYDARTGAPAYPISRDEALAAAVQDFKGQTNVSDIELVTTAKYSEYKNALPAWRVVLDNPKQTHVYVNANTGEIAARRNTLWRIYDWLWMMHIMDYDEREDFNNILIRIVSVVGLLTALSGLTLFGVGSYRRRQNRRLYANDTNGR